MFLTPEELSPEDRAELARRSDEMRRTHENLQIIALVRTNPQQAEESYLAILNQPQRFRTQIVNMEDIYGFVNAFPQHKPALIGKILNDPNEYRRIVQSVFDLCDLARVFPQSAEALIAPVLQPDRAEYFRLIESDHQLQQLKMSFPQHAAALTPAQSQRRRRVMEEPTEESVSTNTDAEIAHSDQRLRLE